MGDAAVRIGAALVVLAALQGLTAPALADARLDRAGMALEEGEFEAAIALFDQAESEDALDRDALARLYEGRALGHHALGAPSAMVEDLRRLASLDPQRTLPAVAPPQVREAFRRLAAEIEAPLGVEFETVEVDDTLRVRLRLRGDVAGLAQSLELAARVDAEAEWSRSEREVTLQTSAGPPVEVVGRALGPGGGVLSEVGTFESPHSLPTVAPALPAAALARSELLTAASPEAAGDDDDMVAVGVGIGAGALALVAAAVVATFLIVDAQNESLVRLSAPRVAFP